MKRRYSHGGLMPYNKRAGKGRKRRRLEKIARRLSNRKVIPGG